MSGHRREVRPRYGRIAALAVSVTVSAVAALAGLGILGPSSASAGPGARTTASGQGSTPPATHRPRTHPSSSDTPSVNPQEGNSQLADGSSSTSPDTHASSTLPADSGSGRRIVFSQSLQRVWLVGAPDDVRRTYLVSGSVTHNLQPGTYSVYSKSRWAVGIDESGVMQYFVRFTQGPTGAAIGFHSIPTKDGVPLQSRAQLGTPESHGCIRQYLPDAIALWNFAPVGTKVVVVA